MPKSMPKFLIFENLSKKAESHETMCFMIVFECFGIDKTMNNWSTNDAKTMLEKVMDKCPKMDTQIDQQVEQWRNKQRPTNYTKNDADQVGQHL